MKNHFRRANKSTVPAGECWGPVRVDTRTKNLAKRLQAGDIAVIDHADVDRVAAEALVMCAPAAVINARKSCTGRYPNLGPSILVEAGIPLIDDCGPDVLSLREGQKVSIKDGQIWQGTTLISQGTVLTKEKVKAAMEEAQAGLSVQLEAFAANTMEYLKKEKDLLVNGLGVPPIRTKFSGRQMLVVVRGYHYREDLNMLKPYIREYRPLLIGVDGGADAIIQAGYKPDLIIGDMDSVTDGTLRCGAELVVHAYEDGYAPGQKRLQSLGLEHVLFPAAGTSEDIAMLMGDELGAELIVAVGTHATLVEFLDKGRAGMASTFLTRLKVGAKLVDAKGVSQLYRARIATSQLVMLLLAGGGAIVAALASTGTGRTMLGLLGAWWDDLWSFFTQIFSLVLMFLS